MPEYSPLKRRRTCSDIPCMIAFSGFMVGWIVVAFLAMTMGSVDRFAAPSDSDGHICGVDRGFEKKKNLFFFDLSKCTSSDVVVLGCPTPQICVEKCPNTYYYGALPFLSKGAHLSTESERKLKKNLRYCLPHVDREMPYLVLADGYHCAMWYVPSVPVGNRCIPRAIAEAIGNLGRLSNNLHHDLNETKTHAIGPRELQSLKGNVTISTHVDATSTSSYNINYNPSTEYLYSTTEYPQDYFSNLTHGSLAQAIDGTIITETVLKRAALALDNTRFVVAHFSLLTVLSLMWSLLFSVLFLLLLRWFSRTAIWIGLVGSVQALAAVAIIFGCHYHSTRLGPTANRTFTDVGLTQDTRQYTELSNFWLALTVVAAAAAALVVILIIVIRNRVHPTMALLDECSTAMKEVRTLLLVPALGCVMQLVVLLFFMLVLLTLFGTVHRWKVEGECYECEDYSSGDFCFPEDFHMHCHTKCPKADCVSTARISLYAYNVLALVWALGFISALNQISIAMTFCTWYFNRRKNISQSVPITAFATTLIFHTGTAAFGSLIMAGCQLVRWLLELGKRPLQRRGGCADRCGNFACCCWCLHNVLRLISRRAYVVTALDGCGLCIGARRGLTVVHRNAAQVTLPGSVTWLVLILCKLFLVIVSVVSCHLCLRQFAGGGIPWLLPSLFSGLVSWKVCSCTFAAYTMGVDTIVYCVMEDLDANDGSARRPYRMSPGVAAALGVTSVQQARTVASVQQPAQPPSPVPQSPQIFLQQQVRPPTPTTFADPFLVNANTSSTSSTPNPQQI